MTVFKDRIRLEKGSDPDKLLAEIAQRSAGAGLPLGLVETTLKNYSEQGERLVAIGSSFRASRLIEGNGHSLRIEADYGQRRGLIARLLEVFKR